MTSIFSQSPFRVNWWLRDYYSPQAKQFTLCVPLLLLVVYKSCATDHQTIKWTECTGLSASQCMTLIQINTVNYWSHGVDVCQMIFIEGNHIPSGVNITAHVLLCYHLATGLLQIRNWSFFFLIHFFQWISITDMHKSYHACIVSMTGSS